MTRREIACFFIAAFFATVAFGLLFLIWSYNRPPQVAISPVTPAAAREADGSRLYALCPTIVPWQAPKYVKEHKA